MSKNGRKYTVGNFYSTVSSIWSRVISKSTHMRASTKTAANSDYNSFMKISRIFNVRLDIVALYIVALNLKRMCLAIN